VGFLTEAIARAREDVRSRRPAAPDGAPNALRKPMDFAGALLGARVSVIAEVKRASPSAGAIADPSTDAAGTATAYERGGASALSVLTEGRHFGGALEDLIAVRAATGLPILRKDFIVDAAQVTESRAAGADAILLIAAGLTDAELAELLAAAREQGMAALIETHTERELERAIGAGAGVIGVNSRDLETLEVDLGRALALMARIPEGAGVRVLESGVRTSDDVLRAADAGADAVLIGEALMRANDPAAKLRELLGR
jgi:indole-3-glycerol phosphate synthase